MKGRGGDRERGQSGRGLACKGLVCRVGALPRAQQTFPLQGVALQHAAAPHLRLQGGVECAGLLHVGYSQGSLSLHGSQLGAEAGGV